MRIKCGSGIVYICMDGVIKGGFLGFRAHAEDRFLLLISGFALK